MDVLAPYNEVMLLKGPNVRSHILSSFFAAIVCASSAQGISVKLGDQVTLLDHKALGLSYFPDAAIAVLRTKPPRLIVSAGVRSFLVQGPDMESLNQADLVLEPGESGSYDNGHAGISGVYRHSDNKLYAIYHAEDQENMGQFQNKVSGFYATAALAVSEDNGESFEKLGPVLTSAQTKGLSGRPDQGCGEACLTLTKDREYVYCYYVDHSRVNDRGVQIFLARSPVDSAPPLPGSWTKYYQGKFGEPGLGGLDTAVVSAKNLQADAAFPHVTYSKSLKKYVMVFNINAYIEYVGEGEKTPRISGTYLTYSEDGIRWTKPEQIMTTFCVPIPTQAMAWHPTLIWDSEASLEGWLVYAHSPSWGHVHQGNKPHHMVGRRFLFEPKP